MTPFFIFSWSLEPKAVFSELISLQIAKMPRSSGIFVKLSDI